MYGRDKNEVEMSIMHAAKETDTHSHTLREWVNEKWKPTREQVMFWKCPTRTCWRLMIPLFPPSSSSSLFLLLLSLSWTKKSNNCVLNKSCWLFSFFLSLVCVFGFIFTFHFVFKDGLALSTITKGACAFKV